MQVYRERTKKRNFHGSLKTSSRERIIEKSPEENSCSSGFCFNSSGCRSRAGHCPLAATPTDSALHKPDPLTLAPIGINNPSIFSLAHLHPFMRTVFYSAGKQEKKYLSCRLTHYDRLKSDLVYPWALSENHWPTSAKLRKIQVSPLI